MSSTAGSLKMLESLLNSPLNDPVVLQHLVNFSSKISHVLQKQSAILEKNIKALVRCIQIYVDLIGNYIESFTDLRESDVEHVKHFCSRISDIKPKSQSFWNAYVEEISTFILEKISNPRIKPIFARELMMNFNAVLQYSTKELQHKIIIRNKHKLCQLMKLLCACGDYDCQINIMRMVFQMCSPEQISKYAQDMFPESEILKNAILNVKWENFNRDARTFLTIVNSQFPNVLSLKCGCLLLNNAEIFRAEELSLNNLWVNFNIGSSSVSIMFDDHSLNLLNLPSSISCGSLADSLQSIHINATNVENVLMSRMIGSSGTAHGSVIRFNLKRPLFTLLKAEHLQIVVLHCPELEFLEKDVLPLMFRGNFESRRYEHKRNSANKVSLVSQKPNEAQLIQCKVSIGIRGMKLAIENRNDFDQNSDPSEMQDDLNSTDSTICIHPVTDYVDLTSDNDDTSSQNETDYILQQRYSLSKDKIYQKVSVGTRNEYTISSVPSEKEECSKEINSPIEDRFYECNNSGIHFNITDTNRFQLSNASVHVGSSPASTEYFTANMYSDFIPTSKNERTNVKFTREYSEKHDNTNADSHLSLTVVDCIDLTLDEQNTPLQNVKEADVLVKKNSITQNAEVSSEKFNMYHSSIPTKLKSLKSSVNDITHQKRCSVATTHLISGRENPSAEVGISGIKSSLQRSAKTLENNSDFMSINQTSQDKNIDWEENKSLDVSSIFQDDLLDAKDKSSTSPCYFNVTVVDYIDLTVHEQNTVQRSNDYMQPCLAETSNTVEINGQSNISMSNCSLQESVKTFENNNSELMKCDVELNKPSSCANTKTAGSKILLLTQASSTLISAHHERQHDIEKFSIAHENILENIASQPSDENNNDDKEKDIPNDSEDVVIAAILPLSIPANRIDIFNNEEHINQVCEIETPITITNEEALQPELTEKQSGSLQNGSFHNKSINIANRNEDCQAITHKDQPPELSEYKTRKTGNELSTEEKNISENVNGNKVQTGTTLRNRPLAVAKKLKTIEEKPSNLPKRSKIKTMAEDFSHKPVQKRGKTSKLPEYKRQKTGNKLSTEEIITSNQKSIAENVNENKKRTGATLRNRPLAVAKKLKIIEEKPSNLPKRSKLKPLTEDFSHRPVQEAGKISKLPEYTRQTTGNKLSTEEIITSNQKNIAENVNENKVQTGVTEKNRPVVVLKKLKVVEEKTKHLPNQSKTKSMMENFPHKSIPETEKLTKLSKYEQQKTANELSIEEIVVSNQENVSENAHYCYDNKLQTVKTKNRPVVVLERLKAVEEKINSLLKQSKTEAMIQNFSHEPAQETEKIITTNVTPQIGISALQAKEVVNLDKTEMTAIDEAKAAIEQQIDVNLNKSVEKGLLCSANKEVAENRSEHNTDKFACCSNKQYDCRSETIVSQSKPPKPSRRRRINFIGEGSDEPLAKVTKSKMTKTNVTPARQKRDRPVNLKSTKKRKLYNLDDISYLQRCGEQAMEAQISSLKKVIETPTELPNKRNTKYSRAIGFDTVEIDTSNCEKCISKENYLNTEVSQKGYLNNNCNITVPNNEKLNKKLSRKYEKSLHFNKENLNLRDVSVEESGADQFDKLLPPDQKMKSHELALKGRRSTASNVTLRQNSSAQNNASFNLLLDAFMDQINTNVLDKKPSLRKYKSSNRRGTSNKSTKTNYSRSRYSYTTMRQHTTYNESLYSATAATDKNKTVNTSKRKLKKTKPVISSPQKRENSSDFSPFLDLIIEKEKPKVAKEMRLTDSDTPLTAAEINPVTPNIIIHSNILVKKAPKSDKPEPRIRKSSDQKHVVQVIKDVEKRQTFTSSVQQEDPIDIPTIQECPVPNGITLSKNVSAQGTNYAQKCTPSCSVESLRNEPILGGLATGLSEDSAIILKDISETTLRACAVMVRAYFQTVRDAQHPSFIDLCECLSKIDNVIREYFKKD